MDDVVSHLVADPTAAFTHAELGVVTVDDNRPAHVAIDADHLQNDDPLLRIPQPAYRPPVRVFRDELRRQLGEHDRIDELVGVVLFGSVARGTADRVSDAPSSSCARPVVRSLAPNRCSIVATTRS